MGTGQPLRILLIEDSCDDAELLMLALLGDGMACTIDRVETHPQLEAALAGPRPDIVICDGHLPGFDGMQALAWVRAAWADVPFLFCLGSIGGSAVDVEMLRAGDGSIGKDELQRLPALIRDTLR